MCLHNVRGQFCSTQMVTQYRENRFKNLAIRSEIFEVFREIV